MQKSDAILLQRKKEIVEPHRENHREQLWGAECTKLGSYSQLQALQLLGRQIGSFDKQLRLSNC